MGAGAVIVAALLYCSFTTATWRGYISPSWDLGIFTQLADRYAHFQAPIVNIKGEGFNLLGDHFHPILVLLGPIFRIWPSGLTLLIVQALLFALSVWPLARLAVERLGTAAGCVLSVAYVLSWGLLNAIWAQFHEIAFAVPLLSFGLVWWLRGRLVLSSVAIALLVFVKEDMGLTVAAFGVAIFLRQRSQRTPALFHIVWGLAWFLLSTLVILPAFNPKGGWDYTDKISTLSTLTSGIDQKLAVVCLLILAAGVVGLRSPFMLMLLPTLAWRFLGNNEFYWGWTFHYSAVLIPIATVALLDAARPRHRLLAPTIALLSALAMIVNTQINILWRFDAWASSDASQAIAVASQYHTVATDIYLLAYLVPHTDTYWYGTLGDLVPDAFVMNRDKLGEDVESWAESRYGTDWVTVYQENEWQVVAPAHS